MRTTMRYVTAGLLSAVIAVSSVQTETYAKEIWNTNGTQFYDEIYNSSEEFWNGPEETEEEENLPKEQEIPDNEDEKATNGGVETPGEETEEEDEDKVETNGGEDTATDGFQYDLNPTEPITLQEAMEKFYRWEYPISEEFIPEGYQLVLENDPLMGLAYWTLKPESTPVMASSKLVTANNFEELEEYFLEGSKFNSKNGYVYTIIITESFDFEHTIVVNSDVNVNILFQMPKDKEIVLGVKGAFRHFDITSTQNHFTFELKGVTLDGGGIGGGINFNGNNLNLFSGTIQNCIAGYGGGLYVDGGAMAEAMTFKGNTSKSIAGDNKSNKGGAIYIKNGTLLLMSETKILNNGNLDVKYGGGVYADEGCTVDIRLSVIEGNEASQGGGIALGKNAILELGGYIQGNKAGLNGGGIHGEFTTRASDNVVTESSTLFINGHVKDNVSAVGAGGIYGGDVTVGKNGFIARNRVSGPGTSSAVICYNFFMEDGYVRDNVLEEVSPVHTGSTTIYCRNAVISGGEISGNTYTVDTKDRSMGGGILVVPKLKGETFEMTGGKISGNKAVSGGGVLVLAGTTKFATKPVIKIHGGEISNNEAVFGGGVYTDHFDLEIKDAQISGNTYEKYGGGIYTVGQRIKVENSQITDNIPASENGSQYGGGIYMNFYQPDMECEVHISNNTVISGNESSNGGGMYMGIMNGYDPGTLIIQGPVTISDNQASKKGGGLFLSNLYGNITGSVEITDNTALNGGGVAISKVQLSMDGDPEAPILVSRNEGTEGGGFYVYNEARLNLKGNVEINNNQAVNGGAVFTNDLEGILVQAPTVIFSENVAETGYNITDEADILLHDTLIHTKSFTKPFAYAYNNMDIVYQDGEVKGDVVTITFESNGGTPVDAAEAEKGSLVPKPVDPIKSDHIFKGWFKEAGLITLWDFAEDKAEEDLILYAKWEKENTEIPGGGGNSGGRTAIVEKEAKKEEIPVLTDNHIQYVHGYPDNTFRTENSITRGELAVIIFNLTESGDKNNGGNSSFADVAPDAWYANSVAYVEKHGIMTGYPDGQFKPENNVTRAELVTAFAFFFGMEEHSHPFNDVSGAHWAYKFIANAYSKGWISGYPDGSFKPGQSVNRGETVTMINQILGRKLALEDISENMNPYRDLEETHWAYTDIIEASFTHEFQLREDGFEQWENIN